jgi:hypothetical protein
MIKLVYCAGQYSAPTKADKIKNVEIAEEYGKQVLALGFIPIIPHKTSSLWDYDERFSHWTNEEWIEHFCFPLLARCDILFLYPGWQKSSGARDEHQFALDRGMEIAYSIDDLKLL